jgi:AcrR family transcriptional regulator
VARVPLSRERVLRAAVAYADEHGIASVSMRKLGEALGVEAMSLYNHVANKDELLGDMVDVVFREIGLPAGAADWRTAMRQRAVAVRRVLSHHRWAIGLMSSTATSTASRCRKRTSRSTRPRNCPRQPTRFWRWFPLRSTPTSRS